MQKIKKSGAAAAAGRSTYEAKVGVEAVIRSGGKNPQLKGVGHEILYRDSITTNPKNLASGVKGVLSKSAGTKLMGTKETVKAYNAAVSRAAQGGKQITQRMTSTGISSADTSRIAAQTIGGALKAASVAKTALTSGGVGAALSGGFEMISSGIRLVKQEIDGGEFLGNMAKEMVGGGLAAAGGSAAATASAVGTATLLAATVAPAWVPGAVAVGAAVTVGTGIKVLWDGLTDELF